MSSKLEKTGSLLTWYPGPAPYYLYVILEEILENKIAIISGVCGLYVYYRQDSQFAYATYVRYFPCTDAVNEYRNGPEVQSANSPLQGASRDIFLTNRLEPRPVRVEVQLNMKIARCGKISQHVCSFTGNSI